MMTDLLAEEPRSETTPLLSVLCPLLHPSLLLLLLLLLLLGECPNTLCRIQITVSATMIAALVKEASSGRFATPPSSFSDVSRQTHGYMSLQSQGNSVHEILGIWPHLACTGPARAILPPRDGTAEKAVMAAACDRRMRPAAVPRISWEVCSAKKGPVRVEPRAGGRGGLKQIEGREDRALDCLWSPGWVSGCLMMSARRLCSSASSTPGRPCLFHPPSPASTLLQIPAAVCTCWGPNDVDVAFFPPSSNREWDGEPS
jgi:hypothetical protein